MLFWIMWRDTLIHITPNILLPNPANMAYATENIALLHDNAVDRLISKQILDQTKVGDEQKQERAMLIDTFLTDYGV